MALCATGLLPGVPAGRVALDAPSAAGLHPADTTRRVQVLARYAALPLRFEWNQGQADPRGRFVAHGAGLTVFLTQGEAVLTLTGAPQRASASHSHGRAPGRIAQAVLRLRLLGTNPRARVVALDRLPGRSSYFLGADRRRWRSAVPAYARVAYRDLLPGGDQVFYGHGGQLEYDLVLAPGAHPGRIVLAVEGARRLALDAAGDQVLGMPGGTIRQLRPRGYQVVGGARHAVAVRYVLRGGDRVGMQVGAYDGRRPLVLDPVLRYATYPSGSDFDYGAGVAVDTVGNAYVTGYTASTDFPTTFRAPQRANGGMEDAFVVKIGNAPIPSATSTAVAATNTPTTVVPSPASSTGTTIAGPTRTPVPPTSTPVPATNTRGSATSTPGGTGVVPPTATRAPGLARPTVGPTRGPARCLVRLALALTLSPANEHVAGDGTLTVGVRTAQRTHVTLTLRVHLHRLSTTGTGTRRHRTDALVLYRVSMDGVADAHGRFTRRLRVGVVPSQPADATLSVTVRYEGAHR